MAGVAADGTHLDRGPGQEMSDVAVVYNDQDTSALKVSTKLQEVISPAATGGSAASTTPPTVTTVTPQSSETHIKQVEDKLPDMAALVIIATDELMGPSGKGLWKKMLTATKRGSKKNIVTITCYLNGPLPIELQQYTVLNYSDSNFTQKVKAILEGEAF